MPSVPETSANVLHPTLAQTLNPLNPQIHNDFRLWEGSLGAKSIRVQVPGDIVGRNLSGHLSGPCSHTPAHPPHTCTPKEDQMPTSCRPSDRTRSRCFCTCWGSHVDMLWLAVPCNGSVENQAASVGSFGNSCSLRASDMNQMQYRHISSRLRLQCETDVVLPHVAVQKLS